MTYNTVADYSKVLGGRNLPYLVELDVPNCVFKPSAGHNQKYCYTITAVSGVSNPQDLDYFILDIDPDIAPEQIENIEVVVNGAPMTVRYNTSSPNVRLNSAGLRFDFELSRNNGFMEVCFELTAACEVGPVPVSLYGNNASKTGLTIGGPYLLLEDDEPEEEPHKKKCFEVNACKSFAVKVLELSVPVSIKPIAIAHKPEVKCLGDARMEPGTKECHQEHEKVKFTLHQKISVKTPVEFIVKTCYDKLCVEEREDEDETGECEG